MLISYQEFCTFINKHIQEGTDFYLNLIETIIKYPTRYFGQFRLSNPKTKIIQNVTQSREIKFGDSIEELTTEYIEKLGYKNINKKLYSEKNKQSLEVDQLFTDGNIIYFAEMKIRDDHDSTKKRGQYENFVLKLDTIIDTYPSVHIDASMWFVDDAFNKNKNYYKEMITKTERDNASLHLYYGNEFLHSLNDGDDAWNELLSNLNRYKSEYSSDLMINLPDFGTSKIIYEALLKLPNDLWKKLNSKEPIYRELRNTLFSSGDNIEKVKKIRGV